MKTKSVISIIVIILVLAFVFIFTTNKETKKTNNNEEIKKTTTENVVPELKGDFSNISYTETITMPGNVTESKMWIKEGNVKRETELDEVKTIFIVNTDKAEYISYNSNQEFATKINFESYEDAETPLDKSEKIPDIGINFLSDENFDGKSCKVISYTASGQSVKTWVWKENGMPLKIENDSPGGKTTIEYKNVIIGSVKDSDFDLPNNIEIKEFNIPVVPE